MSLDVYLKDANNDEAEELYWANITHNLGEMAGKAGIYRAIWRPEEMGVSYAREIIDRVEKGLRHLKERPEYFKQFNSPNGWGLYKNFVPFVEEYLKALKKNPDAKIIVSR